MDTIITKYIECACHTPGHTLRFHILKENDGTSELYVENYLTPLPWWKRVWVAVQYVFGHQASHCWEETILNKTQIDQLHEIIDSCSCSDRKSQAVSGELGSVSCAEKQ